MRHVLLWEALGILLVIIPAGSGRAMTTPVQKCAATKRKLAGKEFAALTACDARAVGKGVAVDPTCASKAVTAFATAWAKAEAKKGGCSTTNDESTVESLAEGLKTYLEDSLVLAGAPSTCTAAKFRAAGKKGACQLGCDATAELKALPPSDPRVVACLAACSAKFSSAFAKAEAKRKGACHTTGDALAIQTEIDAGFFVTARNDLISCPAGQIGCSGTCLDPSSDASDCGSCGNVCRRNEICSNGGCDCPSPFALCRVRVINHGLVDPAARASSPAGEAAQPRFNDCAFRPCVCTDRQDDPFNCGACGTVCPTTANVCVAGECACPSPDTVCGAFCTNVASDRTNCGTCGHVCPGNAPYCVAGTCSATTILYPQSTALRRLVFDELNAFAHNCVSIFLDDTQGECGGCFDGGSSCCLGDVCCNEEDHHQGLARTPALSDGSIYFFLSHSGVQGVGDTGRLMQFRYDGTVDNGHVTQQGRTAPMEERLLLADETHPSAITFLPDVNHFDGGYLFVAKEYDGQKVTVYYWQPHTDLKAIGDIYAGLTKPSHVVIDKITADDYYLVVFDDSYKNGSPYRARAADLFPSGTPGAMNVSAFQPLPYFKFDGDLGSQAQLIRDSSNTWYLLAYNSPDTSGFGDDSVHIRNIQFDGDAVTLAFETAFPKPIFFPAGGTSFTNSGTHYVDNNGRLLIASSERWAQEEGDPYGWESRVDECAPVN